MYFYGNGVDCGFLKVNVQNSKLTSIKVQKYCHQNIFKLLFIQNLHFQMFKNLLKRENVLCACSSTIFKLLWLDVL